MRVWIDRDEKNRDCLFIDIGGNIIRLQTEYLWRYYKGQDKALCLKDLRLLDLESHHMLLAFERHRKETADRIIKARGDAPDLSPEALLKGSQPD
jgi:hypothetical protein